MIGRRCKEIGAVKKMRLGKRTHKNGVKKAANVLRLLSLERTVGFKLNKDAVGQVLCIIFETCLYKKDRERACRMM